MDVIVERVAGLDIGKADLKACVRVPATSGRRRFQQETRTFSSMTRQLQALAAWLRDCQVSLVVMEATGDFWKPVFYLLEEQFTVWLVNARDVKKVPGRKTDVRDAEWLAQLAQHGLISPCFVPPPDIRRLRDLTRQRANLVRERVRVLNRIEKILEDAPLTELPGRWFVSWVGLERCEATVRPRGWGSGDAAGSGIVGGAADMRVAGGDRRGVRAVPAA